MFLVALALEKSRRFGLLNLCVLSLHMFLQCNNRSMAIVQ